MCLFVMHRGFKTCGSNGRKNLKSQMAFGKLGVLCNFITSLTAKRKNVESRNMWHFYYFYDRLYLNIKITYVLIKFVHLMWDFVTKIIFNALVLLLFEPNTCNCWKLLHFPAHCNTCISKNQRGKSNSKMKISNVEIWFTMHNFKWIIIII